MKHPRLAEGRRLSPGEWALCSCVVVCVLLVQGVLQILSRRRQQYIETLISALNFLFDLVWFDLMSKVLVIIQP